MVLLIFNKVTNQPTIVYWSYSHFKIKKNLNVVKLIVFTFQNFKNNFPGWSPYWKI